MKSRNLFFDENKTASTAQIALWYAVSNMIVNGLGFLTTPIFSRVLSKEDFGQFSNFLSWETLLAAIVTLNLISSIMRAKYDFGEEFDSYVLSALLLSNIFTLFVYGITEIFPSFFVRFLSMDRTYIRLLFLELLAWPAFQYLQTKHRVTMKYRFCVITAVASALLRVVIAVALVLNMNNKLLGRVLGYVVPFVLVAVICGGMLFKSGKCIKLSHMKYACRFSIPLIPHTISGHILGTSDKVMIKGVCGAQDAALYSIPYTVSSIAAILWTAMNQAWAPWQFDQMNANNTEEIRKKSKWYLGIFAFIIVGILLIAPEILYILGGESYMEAIWVMPPVIVACAYQFVYAMYVNVEMYMKRNIQISLVTMGAAVFNLITNALFIPRFGYIAAAYTTLAGYLILLIVHFVLVNIRGEYTDSFDTKYVFGIVAFITLAGAVMFILYKIQLLRYVVVAVYIALLLILGLKNKKVILDVLRIKRG